MISDASSSYRLNTTRIAKHKAGKPFRKNAHDGRHRAALLLNTFESDLIGRHQSRHSAPNGVNGEGGAKTETANATSMEFPEQLYKSNEAPGESNSTLMISAAKQRLDEILKRPVKFLAATSATLTDEKAMLRLEGSFREASLVHSRRRDILGCSNIIGEWQELYRTMAQGLENPAALCYRRSVLQAFLHLPIFLNWINPKMAKNPIRDHLHALRYPATADVCVLCKLRSLVAMVWSESSPNELRSSLRSLDKAISAAGRITRPRWKYTTSYVQADGHEFLCWVLEILENYFNKPTVHTGPGQDEIGLQLQLVSPEQGNLSTYISAYFSETIQGVRCDSCKSQSDRQRTRSISISPEVLIVQLQRFQRSQNVYTGRVESKKITKHIKYGQYLDLSRHCSAATDRDDGTLRYRISSVVHHIGSLNNGHYMTIAQGPGGIVKLDDETVSRSSLAEMMNPGKGWTPYILTYVVDAA